MYMNNPSRDAEKGKATTTTQQKGKATQHNSPETVIFQRKNGCLGWDSNPRPSAYMTCTFITLALAHVVEVSVHVYVYVHEVFKPQDSQSNIQSAMYMYCLLAHTISYVQHISAPLQQEPVNPTLFLSVISIYIDGYLTETMPTHSSTLKPSMY